MQFLVEFLAELSKELELHCNLFPWQYFSTILFFLCYFFDVVYFLVLHFLSDSLHGKVVVLQNQRLFPLGVIQFFMEIVDIFGEFSLFFLHLGLLLDIGVEGFGRG